MQTLDIFTLALGLQSPWYVEKVEFLNSLEMERELHIWINFKRGGEFVLDDGSRGSAYDTTDKTWRHLNFFQHKCFLHARVPRILNKEGKPRVVCTPWARPDSGFTLLMEAYMMLLAEGEMPMKQVANNVDETAPRVWRVFDHWIKEAISLERLDHVVNIGVDETSRKKGHHYITHFVNLDTGRTIYVTEGKDSSVFDRFVTHLEERGGSASNIKHVSMDMSPAFISGKTRCFPDAQIVFDKFHLVQLVNNAMDEVRKMEVKDAALIKGQKYTFLRKKSNLSDKKRAALEELVHIYPIIGKAYRIKELFIYALSGQKSMEQSEMLECWCQQAKDSGMAPFIKAANQIKACWSGVIAYFSSGITNGILEGLNSKIQLAKRRARGFRNIKNFINMIYFVAGSAKNLYPYQTL